MKGKSSVVQGDVNRTEKSSLEYISICLVSMIKFVGSVNKINKKAGHSVEYGSGSCSSKIRLQKLHLYKSVSKYIYTEAQQAVAELNTINKQIFARCLASRLDHRF